MQEGDTTSSTSRPTTMKAVVYRKYGEPKEVLELVNDFPVPRIQSKTEMLVKVHAAAINPVDWKMTVGYMAMINSRLPFVPGFDISGVVVETGPGVKNFKPGDEVFAMADYKKCSGFAEYVVIDKRFVAPKPKNYTHAEAASIPLVALTSYQALVDHGKIASGQKVLVIGGSSGTGSFGVQYAKHIGAEVTAVCSGKNAEFVQELGATRIIDYNQEDWSEALKGQNFDLIYDCVGGVEYWEKAPQVLKPGGRFATIAGDKQEPISIGKVLSAAGSIVNRNFWALVSGSPSYEFVMCKPSGKQLTHIGELIEKGAIKPFVSRVFAFEEAKEMFEESMSGRARGKLVLGMVAEEQQQEQEEIATEEGKGKDKLEEKKDEVKEEKKEDKEEEKEEKKEENEEKKEEEAEGGEPKTED